MSNTLRASPLFCVYFLAPKARRQIGLPFRRFFWVLAWGKFFSILAVLPLLCFAGKLLRMSNTLRASPLFCVYFLAPKWTRSFGCTYAQSALFSPLRGNLLRKLSFSKALFYNLANASDKINFCVRYVKSGCRFDVFFWGFLRWKVFFRFLRLLPLLCFLWAKLSRMSNTPRALPFFCVYFLAPKWTRSLGCAYAQSALFSPLRGNLLRKLSFSKALFYNLATLRIK